MKKQEESAILSGKGASDTGRFSGVKEAAEIAKKVGATVSIEVEADDEKPEYKPPKEARIKQAENGYIICWYDNSGSPMLCGGEKSVIAKDFGEVAAELKKYMEAE